MNGPIASILELYIWSGIADNKSEFQLSILIATFASIEHGSIIKLCNAISDARLSWAELVG